MAPAFQADPSIPRGSIRVIWLPDRVELQNSTHRTVPVFLIFLKPETLRDITLMAQMALTPAQKDDP
jgi:hypothetical protein